MRRRRKLESTRRAACLAALAVVLAAIAWPHSAQALWLRDDLWVANDTVLEAVVSNNVLYLAGSFTHVGPPTGSLAVLDAASGAAQPPHSAVVGEVKAMAADGAGGWFIGGLFTSVRGELRSNLAHLSASGNLTPWAPATDAAIRALAVNGNTVFVAGEFATVNGQSRAYIAAIDAATGALTNWNAGANDVVQELVLHSGVLYAGGRFTSIGQQSRARLAALDPATGAATGWIADTDATVTALAAHGNTLYVGGAFSIIGGQPRSRFAAVSTTTGTVLAFDPNADSSVFALAVRALDVFPFTVIVYAGGNFTSVGGQTRNHLAAVDGTSGALTAWNPNADNQVYTLLVYKGPQPLDPAVVYVGGNFSNVGGQARTNIAALDATLGNATSWNPYGGDWGAFTHVQCLGGGNPLRVGGFFGTMGGQKRHRLAALDLSTGLPTSWDPNADAPVRALVVSGNTVYAGGEFTAIGGQPRSRIAAIDAGSGVATGWITTSNGRVADLALSGNTLYAAGEFTVFGGQHRARIAAVDVTNPAISNAFNPNADGAVNAIALRTLNQFPFTTTVFAGGAFSTIGGQPRSNLAALDGTSGTATGWVSNANGPVYALAIRFAIRPLDPTWVYAGGGFTSIGGQSRRYLAAVDIATGAATGFNPDPDTYNFPSPGVHALRVSGGLIYAGGTFTTIGGQACQGLASLDAATGTSMGWDPNPDYIPFTLAQDANTLYVGGAFSSVLGESRWCLAGLPRIPTDSGERPQTAMLEMIASPNPFRGATALRIRLPAATAGEVAVIDAAGRIVRCLRRGAFGRGELTLTWDGRNDGGDAVGAGVYWLRVSAGSRKYTHKVVRLPPGGGGR